MTVHAFPKGEQAAAEAPAQTRRPSRIRPLIARAFRVVRLIVEGFGWLGIVLAVLLA